MPLVAELEAVTSLRYDEQLGLQGSPLYMPQIHRARLVSSIEELGWAVQNEKWLSSHEAFIEHIKSQIHIWRIEQDLVIDRSPLKVRIALSSNIEAAFTISKVPRVPDELLLPLSLDAVVGSSDARHGNHNHAIWTVYLDTVRTAPFRYSNIKSNQRRAYNAARARLQIVDYSTPTDVLLMNEAGMIMETSISTVYIKRDGKWITPSLASGCQVGTTRRWALDQGYCVEKDIHIGSLEGEQLCIISNGVKGFALGCIVDSNRPKP